MNDRKPAPEKVDIRMPGEMRTRLVEDAARDTRSINQEAVYYSSLGMRAAGDRVEALERIEAKLDGLLGLLEKK